MPVAVMKNKDMNDNAIKYNQKWKLGLRPFEITKFEFILCRHLDRISDRLLRFVSLSDLRIAIFSSRHKLQRPLPHS